MQWKHTFKHVDVSESLKMYAQGQFEKAGKFLLKETQWHIFYSKGKHHDCAVEVTVHNGTGHFKATAHCDDFYTAVDMACQKLEKQFQKKKEKLQHHKDFSHSKEAKMDRVNARLEYDNSPFPNKKPA